MYLAVSWVLLCVGVVVYILGGFLMVSGWLVVVVGLGALGFRFLVLCLYGVFLVAGLWFGFASFWVCVWVVFCSVALAWCVWSVLGVLGDFLGFWFYVGCCGGHFLVGLLVA